MLAGVAAVVGRKRPPASSTPSGTAHSGPPCSWAARLTGSGAAAERTGAVATVAASMHAGMSYARAVLPAAADAPLALHSLAVVRDSCCEVVQKNQRPVAGDLSPCAAGNGAAQREEQVCLPMCHRPCRVSLQHGACL